MKKLNFKIKNGKIKFNPLSKLNLFEIKLYYMNINDKYFII